MLLLKTAHDCARESDATASTTIFLLLNHSIFVVSSNHVLSGTFATEATALLRVHNDGHPELPCVPQLRALN